MQSLTPKQMATFLGIQGKRQECAPNFLVTPNYRIAKKDLVVPKKRLSQYNHLLKNVRHRQLRIRLAPVP